MWFYVSLVNKKRINYYIYSCVGKFIRKRFGLEGESFLPVDETDESFSSS